MEEMSEYLISSAHTLVAAVQQRKFTSSRWEEGRREKTAEGECSGTTVAERDGRSQGAQEREVERKNSKGGIGKGPRAKNNISLCFLLVNQKWIFMVKVFSNKFITNQSVQLLISFFGVR